MSEGLMSSCFFSSRSFWLAISPFCAFSPARMTRPQVEFCAKLLMVAIICTFIWGAYHVLALMGIV
jgi:hypothetical protein